MRAKVEAPYRPLDAEGLPGHHYRFESILRSRFLIKDETAELGYSFSGGDLPFDPAGVREFDTNAKAADYEAYPSVAQQMKRFNKSYTNMVNLLQQAFNCPGPKQQEQARDSYDQAVGIMRNMPNIATCHRSESASKRHKGRHPLRVRRPGDLLMASIRYASQTGGIESMAFPDDLADVAAFKIHPAIGCARLANNDDYYEFFDYEEKRKAGQAQSLKYMTLRNGKHWIMRQAVRFRIFAYHSDGSEIGELTEDDHGPARTAARRGPRVWPIENSMSGREEQTPVVEAQASATAGETKRLEGDNPWRQGKVWLGEITGNGLFIPPKGGVYRKTENNAIPPYGSHRSDNGVLDTTSDGSISVSLAGAGNIPIVPACVIVAPQDHSPDVNPEQIDNCRECGFREGDEDGF